MERKSGHFQLLILEKSCYKHIKPHYFYYDGEFLQVKYLKVGFLSLILE